MNQRLERLFFVLALAGTLAGLLRPLVVRAQDNFDYNYILSDDDLTDYGAMSLEQIQTFLQAKGSVLASYVDPVTSLRAAQIIYTSAQDFQLSPKFLLALVQKEQSLIDNPNPSQYNFDWAAGYAVCDGCNVADPVIQRYRGFYNQIYNAAKRIRQDYFPSLDATGKTVSGLGVGYPKLIDGVLVTPATRATAIAYTYTPHLHGNQLLFAVWNRYFTRAYPDGSLLTVAGEHDWWLIENGLRRKFKNQGVFLSRYDSLAAAITVSRTELLKYPPGATLEFPNYSLLITPKGTVYLLVGDTVRGFASREALRRVGINPAEIIKVQPEDLVGYGEGEPITVKSVYPLGTLLQDRKTGGIYWVQDGVKHPIWSRELMRANFPGRHATKATAKGLAQYPTSSPLLFPDGQLVRSQNDPTVYLISNKQRRPFASEQAFTELGFKLQNVITTSEAALATHELGPVINQSY